MAFVTAKEFNPNCHVLFSFAYRLVTKNLIIQNFLKNYTKGLQENEFVTSWKVLIRYMSGVIHMFHFNS